MRGVAITMAVLLGAPGPVQAFELEPGKPLRLVGEAPAAPEGAPKRFVIDALLTEGDEPFASRIEGWFASLDPADAGSGEISGGCVQERCALSVSLSSGELGVIGDLAAPAAPSRGQLVLEADDAEQPGPPAPAAFTPFGEDAPGLGRLAPRGSIGSHALSDLLAWAGADLGFSNLDDEEPDERERAALAAWQAETGRPPSGLLLAADLEALRAQVETARRQAGWTVVQGAGWSGGHPGALLRPAAGAGGERRFVSADGKAELALAVEPPLDEAAWDALVDRETADDDANENRSYTRVNDDFELSVTRGGVRHVRVWRNREGGLVRMTYRYPADDEALARFEPILVRTFRVGEEVRPE